MSRFSIRPAKAIAASGLTIVASQLIVATLVILFLYAGREIFQPLVVAALLAFILSPLIRRLRSWWMPRIPAVLLSVLLAITVLAGLSATIVMQVSQLAEVLPKYEGNLRAKIHAINGGALTTGALEKASGTLKGLQTEINTSTAPEPTTPEQKPMPVVVRQLQPTGLQSISDAVSILVTPVTSAALTILFLIFILLQREDIRDRFLRIVGTDDLHRNTALLDDAATRLSRFFLLQTIVNAGFGAVIGIGLAAIGIPNAALWGSLAALLRFLPFIGAIVAAVLPVALAAAVDPGWSLVIATAALFIVADTLAGNIIEPLLYGQHTGLSPLAIVIAAMFWASLWGPIGLLLATPLTVCLVVLGSHIEAFQLMAVLLGDEPALEEDERFYQRLLSGNATEAADQAEKQLKEVSLSTYYDSVPMQALALAQADAAAGKLLSDKQLAMRDTLAEVVDTLADYGDGESSPEAGGSLGSVLCIASRSPLDEAAALMLVHLLEKQGLTAQSQPFADVAMAKAVKIEAIDPRLVCLSYFGAGANPAHVRYLIRRLKRRMPMTKFLAGYWLLGTDAQKSEDWKTSVGADFVATSLAEAVSICVREAGMARVLTEPSEVTAPEDVHAADNGRVLASSVLQLSVVPG